jgi:hypothetical protein
VRRHALVELEGNTGLVPNLGCKLHPGQPGQLPRLLSGGQTGGHRHQSRYALVGVLNSVLGGQLVGNCLPAVLCCLASCPSASQMNTVRRLER